MLMSYLEDNFFSNKDAYQSFKNSVEDIFLEN